MPHGPLVEELGAAAALAAKLRLGKVEPTVLNLAKHTSIKLSPLPIVARVPPSPWSESNIALEVAVGRHLASRGAPVVSPVAAKSAGPYLERGYAITLWQFVEGQPVRSVEDVLAAANALKKSHAALKSVTSALPSYSVAIDSCGDILSGTTATQTLAGRDRAFLADLFSRLRNDLEKRRCEVRPLHGDAHIGNALITSEGAIWMDLEAVCTGPLEWDVVALPRKVQRLFEPLDPELLDLLSKIRRLCAAVWCWADFDRNPQTAEAATFQLAQLRARHS